MGRSSDEMASLRFAAVLAACVLVISASGMEIDSAGGDELGEVALEGVAKHVAKHHTHAKPVKHSKGITKIVKAYQKHLVVHKKAMALVKKHQKIVDHRRVPYKRLMRKFQHTVDPKRAKELKAKINKADPVLNSHTLALHHAMHRAGVSGLKLKHEKHVLDVMHARARATRERISKEATKKNKIKHERSIKAQKAKEKKKKKMLKMMERKVKAMRSKITSLRGKRMRKAAYLKAQAKVAPVKTRLQLLRAEMQRASPRLYYQLNARMNELYKQLGLKRRKVDKAKELKKKKKRGPNPVKQLSKKGQKAVKKQKGKVRAQKAEIIKRKASDKKQAKDAKKVIHAMKMKLIKAKGKAHRAVLL